jgi:hypothetical protein
MSDTKFDPHNPDGEPPFPGKLGALPSPQDPRTLMLASYLPAQLTPAPPSVDWTGKASAWRTLGNDRMGDCEVVTCANLVQLWTSNAGREALLAEADVVKAYTALTGYNPRTGANDNGVSSLAMLNYWRRTGLGPAKGKRKILAFVKLDHRDHLEVRTAINIFGGLLTAFQLPRSARTQFTRGQEWSPATMAAGGARGSWGGHAVALPAYDADGFTCVTWGREQRMTLEFWDAYASEAWAVISTDQVAAAESTGGVNPLGFNLDQLRADLAQITNVRTT